MTSSNRASIEVVHGHRKKTAYIGILELALYTAPTVYFPLIAWRDTSVRYQHNFSSIVHLALKLYSGGSNCAASIQGSLSHERNVWHEEWLVGEWPLIPEILGRTNPVRTKKHRFL